jgi:2-hydroxy-3-keto-5-methylthiopentenyl-1-phosphate phosphatase
MTSPTRRILVSDFDGTMTRLDFYRLVVDHLLPPDVPDYWARYRAGELTHFDALRLYFAATQPGEPVLIDLAHQMELEPNLKQELQALRAKGWDVVVASAGCSWYIDLLLAEADVTLEVHASPGQVEDGRLLMELPLASPFCSAETGIDKAAVVRDALKRSEVVAFAGDGYPDLEPALLVPEEYRFARSALAEALDEQNEPYRPFERWAEVAQALRAEVPT